jgi:hypothetical protein
MSPKTSEQKFDHSGWVFERLFFKINAWLVHVCARKIYICLRGLLGLLGFAGVRQNFGDPALRSKPPFKVICQRRCPQQKQNLHSGAPSLLKRSTPYFVMENNDA